MKFSASLANRAGLLCRWPKSLHPNHLLSTGVKNMIEKCEVLSTFKGLVVVLFLCAASAQAQTGTPSLPGLSVNGGTFTTQQQVVVTTPDSGVTLHYTVNGITPTLSDPVVAPSGKVLITQPGTLKVAGFVGSTSGPVTTASFTITGQVSAGAQSSVVLKSDGTIWTSGDNSYGQLGVNVTPGASSPVQIPGLTGFSAVASGHYHVLALKNDGTVWAWGSNSDGQLGTGTNLNINSQPAQVTMLADVVAVSSGGYHSLALKSDGTVWAWGSNLYGGLGIGTGVSSNIPVQIPGLSGVKAISAGYFHSLVLKTDGTVWAFGYNGDGELGVGTATNLQGPQQITSLTSSVAGIAAGRFHSVYLKSDGTVWSSGSNAQGQLGNNSTTNSLVPVQVSGLTGVSAVSAGFYFSSALKNTGVIWAWGENTRQELGNGSSANSLVPVQVSNISTALGISSQGYHSLAALTNGTVYAWGSNFCGDFGTGVSATQVVPTAIPAMTNVKSVVGGDGFTYAVKNDGTIWTWGNNPNGELGNGTQVSRSTPAQLSSLTGVTQAAAGLLHGVALKSDGTVWTWGYNGYAELGNGTTTNSLTPIQVSINGVVAIAAGAAHTLALRSDGTVWGWGYSVDGELGTGTSGYYYIYPTQVSGLTGVVAISAGYFHSLALKSDGSVWAWGSNSSGQLGTGNTTPSLVPTRVANITGISAISAGYYHNLAVRSSDGTAWAWGNNPNGELGNGTTTASLVPVQVPGLTGVSGVFAGAYHSFALASGTSYGWGANFLGELGNGLNQENRNSPVAVVNSKTIPITKLSGGDYHTLGVSSSGVMYGWGSNFSGQLGLGFMGVTSTPVLSNYVGVPLNQAPPVPTNLLVNYNAANQQATVSWAQTGNLTQSFTIRQSIDNGITWTTLGNVAGDVNSYVVTGIDSTKTYQFQIVANGTYTSSSPSTAATWLASLQITGTPIAPATLTLTTTVAGSVTGIAAVEIYEGNDWLGNYSSAPYSASLPSVLPGLHTYTVIVRNASGAVVAQTSASITITMPPDPLANYRFARGPINVTADLGYQTYVLSVDHLKGIGLDPLGNNASKFPLGLPWFECISGGSLFQVANTNPVTYPTAYQNPVAAYGSAGGGSPLYLNQAYRFAFGSGVEVNTTNYLDFRVSVYAKSQFSSGQTNVAPLKVYTLSLPRPSDTTGWSAFAQSGFVKTYDFTSDGYPLVTKVEFIEGATFADSMGRAVSAPFLLTHTAASSAYCYRIDYAGNTVVNGQSVPMNISNPATSPTYGYGYTLDFSDRAPWISTFISEPHFDGVAMPSEYVGKSINELLKVSTPVTYQFAAPTSAYTALDNSPELRTHPILDKFVSDLGANPLLLTNYVLNQIQLTDALGYNDSGAVNETSINPGGVSRSALATFLEKQGSPAEQCALLVYLLRKANVPCGYVFPNHNTLQMLDARMSKLLRMQLKGAADTYSITTVPQLLNVNYPWVAVYINNQWVHVFPWMKDTSINEGYNITDCLPSGYQTGLQWLQKYINRDASILNLSTEFDNPGTLYPLWINQQLALKGININDVGVKIFDRQNNYNSWSDFPQPWQVTSGSLSSANLKDSLSAISNIFDTIQCVVYSDRNNNGVYDSGEPILDTGSLRAVDLHNRRIMLRTVKTGTNTHTLTLSLEPMRPGTTATEAFVTGGSLINKQAISTSLASTDDNLNFRTVYNRHRALPSGFTIPDPYSTFLGLSDVIKIQDERPLRKGDTAVLCLNYGKVTQDMIKVHARNFWAAQQSASVTGITMDADIAAGEPLMLMGMTYYKQISDFRTWLEPLQKQNSLSFFAHGFSKISPQRNATDGTLPNSGDINPMYPNVDMMFQRMASAYNGTTHPDSGLPGAMTANDWLYVLIGEVSAQEHTVINKFYNVTDSASTVHLLHAAQTASPTRPIIQLTSQNYAAQGAVSYTVNSVTKTLQAWAGPSMWSQITSVLSPSSNVLSDFALVYITPGPVVCANKAYEGVGAFVLNPGSSAAALISGNMLNAPLNGGYSSSPSLDLTWASPTNIQSSMFTADSGAGYSTLAVVSPTTLAPLVYTQEPTASNSTINSISLGTVLLDSGALALSSQYNSSMNFWPTGSSASIISQTVASEAKTGIISGFTSWVSDQSSLVTKYVNDPVNSMTGSFYINDTDLVIPGPFPIQLSRNYDSLNQASNEFGTGWKMGFFSYLQVSVDSSVIYAAEMDGSVVAYRLQTGSSTRWVPTAKDNPSMANQQGDVLGSVANPFNNRIDKTVNGSTTTYTLTGANGSVRTFVVATYTSLGGTGVTRQRPYLQKWMDAQGNYLTFTYGSDNTQTDYGFLTRISSSNGNFLQLNYDIYGHIISANAADGRRLTYNYDTYGDLTSVTRPDASVINFTYSHKPNTGTGVAGYYSEHLITQEIKPGGRILVNAYDSQRRVTQQQSTVGTNSALVVNATYQYFNSQNADGTLTGYTNVIDAYNRATRYDYSASQLTKVTDPLGQTIQTVWYQPGDSASGAYQRSLKQRIDKRGLSVVYKYDANGNLIETDTTGNITGSGSTTAVQTMTYNALNLPTRINEANGNYKVLIYGNLSYPYLATAIQKWTASGMVSETDYSYGVAGTSGTIPFANGVVLSAVQAVGTADQATVNYTYNNNGFPVTETHPTSTTDPSVSFSMVYNLRGQLVKKTDAAGQWSGFAYDDLGNPIWQERHDASGSLVAWNYNYYNANGEIEWTQGSRYSPDDYTLTRYDGAGRVKEKLVWRSEATGSGSGVQAAAGDAGIATTSNQYDLFGNLTQVMDPRGNVTVMTYDEIGQMVTLTQKDVSGGTLATQSFAYELGGKLAKRINPLGGVTSLTYTQTGLPLTQNNPDGTTQSWLYLVDGRLSKETYQNGSNRTLSYDDYNRTITSTLRDSSNNVLSTEVQTLDRRGNVIQKTDAEGNVFNTTFDALNRVKLTTGPVSVNNSAQQKVSHTYDAAGVWQIDINALGEKTVTTFDAEGRPVKVDIQGASGNSVRTISYQYSPDHQSLVRLQGLTGMNTTVFSDLQGKPVLTWNALGGVTISRYDASENLISTTDELNRTTSYVYDGLNRMVQQTLPDGGVIKFVYDAAGNLLQRQMPGGLTWMATYDNASRKLTEKLVQGSTTTRTWGYTYNTTGFGAGKLNTSTDPKGIVSTVTYDAFGRQAQVVAVDASSAQSGVSRTFTYDKRSLLKQLDQTYQNTALSPSTSVQRTYDGYGALVTEKVYVGGVLKDTWQEAHDAAGRRVKLTELNNLSLPYTYKYQADGSLLESAFNNSFYDYGYNLDGRLYWRGTPLQTQNLARDYMGRITNATQSVYGTTLLSETITWRGDSTQNTNAIARLGALYENRSYYYDVRGHLLQESFTPQAGYTGTAAYLFDGGTLGGLGLRTKATLGNAYSGSNTETYSGVAQLTNFSMTGSLVGAAGTPVNQSFDATGEVTVRQGSLYTDTMTWDALGRLVGVSRRSSGNSGFNWTAVYDGLNRRLQTMQQTVTSGTLTGTALTLKSSYDPEVEFLELAVTSPTARYWKVHGPDLNGKYGGLQGTGGLEAVYNGATGVTTSILNDTYGTAQVTVTASGSTASYVFNSVTGSGYGSAPGGVAPVPIDATHDLGNVIAWRGHYVDGTGYYYMGMRYYAQDTGEFLSPDPLGHAACMDLYSYCNGDPVNNLDPDGRCIEGAAKVVGAVGMATTVALGGPASYVGYNAIGDYVGLTNTSAMSPDELLDHNTRIQNATTATENVMGVVMLLPTQMKTVNTSQFSAELSNRLNPIQNFTDVEGGGTVLNRYLSKTGGRWGGRETRLINDNIATQLEDQNFTVTNGAGRAKEQWIPGPGGGTKGGTWVDITATNGNSTVRVQTVDMMADGVTPTLREQAAAARIRQAFPNDTLILIPKAQ